MTAPTHGTPRAVHWHRLNSVPTCAPCRKTAARMRAQQRKRAYLRGAPRLVDACGVRRRLRALAAIGYTRQAIAAELGCRPNNLYRLLNSRRTSAETLAAVAALYDRWSMSPGPNGLARAHAARHGWPPPLAWDDDAIDDPAARPRHGCDGDDVIDEVAIMRAARGDRVHLSPAERKAAVRHLTAAGLSTAQIADRLHTTRRSVTRHRGAARTSVA